jgi:hypothetical protein
MKIQSLFLCGFIAVTLSTRGFALTTEREVTLAYVHEHPKGWSVKATKKESGLIEFTVVRTLSEPKYLVAHLAVHHAGKLIATSDTPVFAKQKDSTFYFSISVEDIAESKFDLSESGLGSTANGVKMDIPVVGSSVYQFRLLDFIPEDVLKSAPGIGDDVRSH